MQKLLLLEDDASLIDGLTYSLKKNGFDIEIARTLREAEILLEMGLPCVKGYGNQAPAVRRDGNNLSVVRKHRAACTVPSGKE